tara:strand:- start:912 stop:3644 length:2733 start_codon:yes stop_codon:yes gene_type:complete
MKISVPDCDVIYLSYDEPNAEKNYADLLTKVPWAKRIHGIEGSDAAHKACAELSETQRFITVDGDNLVNPEFINQSVEFVAGTDLTRKVISWAGYNTINGLMYGNGGIKCWDRQAVLDMKTHENADKDNIKAQVDFCWDLDYVQLNDCMSVVENNYTPHQAWRAGFREGVKMCLLEGEKPSIKEMKEIHWKNLNRLYVWCMVGTDVPNGLFAIYGAREGYYKTMCTDWDHINVRDFEYLNTLWSEKKNISEKDAINYAYELGLELKSKLDAPIDPEPFSEGQSKFFKQIYKSPVRPVHNSIAKTEAGSYDIVMISYGEQNSNQNYKKLLERFPKAKRIHGVKGIANAHIAAAEICDTEMMWVVDGDAEIVDGFNFDYVVPDTDLDAVHVWRSINPINDLEYGYGGVKLLPVELTKQVDKNKVDVNTSISRNFKVMKQLSCITKFNTGPFETWKSAFRECAKLASKVIDRQKEDETNARLKTWTTVGHDRLYGNYALAGASAGMEFGLSRGTDLRLINDFDWLEEKFNNQETFTDSAKQKTFAAPAKTQTDLDTFIVDILDRFELLYGDKIENLRRMYNSNDLSSIFKLANNEDLRKAVIEKNLHSVFRLADADEDLRKAVLEKNIHSIFRITNADEELRKAVVEENIHSIFRLLEVDEELRKAIIEENLYSIARLLPDIADEFKILANDRHALWRVLEKYTSSSLVKPLKTLSEDEFDLDCLSRGQIASKKWLVDKLADTKVKLGNVYLCAGWYATIVPLIVEANIPFDSFRSFDIDSSVWKIAEIFNKDLVLDNWKFKASTKDIKEINYNVNKYITIKSNGDEEQLKDSPDTIINTSCEHIDNFSEWYDKIPKGKLLILQSNNFFDVKEHVNCVHNLDEFADMSPMNNLLYEGKLELEKYTRYMRIGYK